MISEAMQVRSFTVRACPPDRSEAKRNTLDLPPVRLLALRNVHGSRAAT
jgi:hypothetical protein